MIENGSQVSLEYTLKLEDGTTVDTNVGKEPFVYEQGAGQILPALEERLEGLEAEDTKQVTLAASDAYGDVDPSAFREVEPDLVPAEARTAGAMLMASDGSGGQRPIRVHEVADDKIVLDFNHPLAGEQLTFDVRVVAVD